SVSPLTNYYFGTSGTDKRDLETVNAANPDAVVARGRITPAKIVAQTKKLKEKVYDGMAEHTDGNRNILTGSEIVELPLIADATGQPTNTSSAAYINKDVERDSNDAIIEKAVNYTAQLTGKYADDYEIVDAGNNVISTGSGTGDSKTVTATRNNVANMGKITPRKLNITMASVSKVYDTNAKNTATNNTVADPSGTVATITDDPKSSVIGTILSGESTPITEAALGAAWRTLRDNNGATSTYGHKGSTPFGDANASAAANGHDVVYHHMDTAFKNAFGTVAAGNYTVDADAYGKGTITPKPVDPNQFDVVDANGHTVPYAKTYDGTSDRPIEDTWKIQSGATTGLYAQDASHISFALSSKGAYYIDKNGNKTAQTTNTGTAAETNIDAVKAAYHVTAHADEGYEKLLKNYTLNGQTLDSGEAKVYGSGKITRRTINIGLSEPSKIDKVYDGTRNLVDGTVKGKELHHSAFVDADAKANVVYATGTANDNKLVRTKNGAKVDDNAVVTVTGSYADKNVARNAAREIIDKVITYNVSIGDDVGKNYTLSYNDGTTTHTKNAEEGLDLSAKGTIMPKDLSGAFAKITKVYDGTPDVDHTANPTVTPAQVGFTAGAVIAGDDVTLATHNEEFKSPNVRGDGTTKTIDGTEQKNWINYSGLTLGGTSADNYTINATAVGLGEITPLELTPSNVTLTTTLATKEYDGGVKVKKDGSDAISAIKNYITDATVTVGGSPVSVLTDLELQ
ncbi:MAG: filamentous hemagglutinin, partial [Selenomonas sp.]|nr:filamentous hemagglutinin [Selenomonas sp.]